MNLLLASYLHPDLDNYLSGRIVYIDDAAAEMRQAPFAQEELKAVGEAAQTLVPLTVSQTALNDFQRELELADCVYVASGEVFRLLYALKSTGADKLLADAVRGGKFFAGSSAGAMIAGPSIAPASVMDDPSTAPELTDYTGLDLTSFVVVPHAQGTTGPYSIDVISQTVQDYGREWNLLLLRDGQALVVDEQGSRLI
ncbi:Type 1 glutamine amidotransferase-like domain-containing protein [Corynebacterium urogenitale]